MTPIVRPYIFARGMTLLYPHTDKELIKLARIEICQLDENGAYVLFIKALHRPGDTKIAEGILNRHDAEHIPRISYDFCKTEGTLQDAVLRVILIENEMLHRGWQILNRKWAQEKDGLETVAAGFGIARLLPSTPRAQGHRTPPTHGFGQR